MYTWQRYGRYGLYVSQDGGASWSISHLQNVPMCDQSVASVSLDIDGRVYALLGWGTYSTYDTIQPQAVDGCGGLAISADNGRTWYSNSALPNPPFRGKPENIYIDGIRIYVASDSGLGFSDDIGVTWTFKNQSSGWSYTNHVKCVIGRGQTIIVGLYGVRGAVATSEDGGLTWTTVKFPPFDHDYDIWTMFLTDDTITPATAPMGFNKVVDVQEGVLYAASTGVGLFSTNDFFTTWMRNTTADGLAGSWTSTITGSGNNLYLGTHGSSGLSISRNNGQTWMTKTTNDGLPGNDIGVVFVQCTLD